MSRDTLIGIGILVGVFMVSYIPVVIMIVRDCIQRNKKEEEYGR